MLSLQSGLLVTACRLISLLIAERGLACRHDSSMTYTTNPYRVIIVRRKEEWSTDNGMEYLDLADILRQWLEVNAGLDDGTGSSGIHKRKICRNLPRDLLP